MTSARLPAINMSVARLIASFKLWRQPYLLSFLDLVTESFTLIAGTLSSPFFHHVVESVHTSRCLFGDTVNAIEHGRERL